MKTKNVYTILKECVGYKDIEVERYVKILDQLQKELKAKSIDYFNNGKLTILEKDFIEIFSNFKSQLKDKELI